MRREESQGIRSRSKTLPGTLFIVGVPIGHPDDLGVRARRILHEVDLVASKDPRATAALLAHHAIQARVTTYDRSNAAEKAPILLARLRQGAQVALVSDCGMPALYDPGRLLIAAAAAATIPIEVIPGPTAAATAVALSGFDGNAFLVEGRCTGGINALTKRMQPLQAETRTLVFLLPAGSIVPLLTVLSTVLGNRRAVAAENLTTEKQRIRRGRIATLLREFRECVDDPTAAERRSITVVVDGRAARTTRSRKTT